MKKFLDRIFKESKTSEINNFLYACSKERDRFCQSINAAPWDTNLRTKAEGILVMYDQLRDRLKPAYKPIEFFKKMTIYRGDNRGILVERYNIINSKLFAVRLHRFVSSDHDCIHDHPWNFATLILKTGYVEKFEDKNGCIKYAFRKPWTIHYRRAEHKHAVQLLDGVPAWTLIVTFRVRRQWGFWKNKIWQHWKLFNSTNICE